MTGRRLPASLGQPIAQHGRRSRVPRENAGVAYQLKILDAIAGTEPDGLIPAIRAAIVANGCWEHFVEVRMSAGPTVQITAADQDGYEVSVTWGSQHGNLTARALQPAIECADRLACEPPRRVHSRALTARYQLHGRPAETLLPNHRSSKPMAAVRGCRSGHEGSIPSPAPTENAQLRVTVLGHSLAL
jgi:hypothetical protein